MSHLRELYQEVILDHNKSPRNFHAMSDATGAVEGYNPLCGDHYTVYVKVIDGRITDVSFTGAGCAISKASASVMTQAVKGLTGSEATEMFQAFHRLVRGEGQAGAEPDRLGKLVAFSGVSEFPARVKCASLAWHTLKAALEAKKGTVTTE
jgi:nitrogen fixation NifU-like protein